MTECAPLANCRISEQFRQEMEDSIPEETEGSQP